MAVKALTRASGLGALAAVLALATIPASAMAQDEGGEEGGRGRGEVSGDISGGGGGRQQREARTEESRAEQPRAQVQARVEAQAQEAPIQRSNRGGNPGGNPGGGWRNRGNEGATDVQVQEQAQAAPRWGSQRPADGERRGRDWSNGGEVSRPDPAWRGATPATPEGGAETAQRRGRWGARNGTDGDPDRSVTYRDGRRGDNSTGTAWMGDRTGADHARRDGNHYRDGSRYRDGHHSNDGSRWSGYDRNGYNRDHNRWDRHHWRRDHRYNWSNYRNQHRNIFRIGTYYSPYRNYYYRPLSIGFTLSSSFYSNRYWINDPYQYRLPAVYGPYRWVRYYDDVLLVDIYSGEVVDVIRNFFW